jgi:hypothetical protein
MSRWKQPGIRTRLDGELVGHVQRPWVDGDVDDLAAVDLDDEGVRLHVEEVRAGEVLAVRGDFGIGVVGLGERGDPFGDGW